MPRSTQLPSDPSRDDLKLFGQRLHARISHRRLGQRAFGLPHHWIGVLLTVAIVATPTSGLARVLEIAAGANRDVLVSGTTPGGNIVLVSTEKEIGEMGIAQTVIRKSIVADEDGDGVVRFVRPGASSVSSVLAVDVDSGSYQITQLGRQQPPHELASPELASHEHEIQLKLRSGFLLLVRPGSGVWAGRVSDGAVWDSQPDRGLTSWPLDRLGPLDPGLRSEPAPRHALDGDIVIVTNLDDLAVAAHRVGGSQP